MTNTELKKQVIEGIAPVTLSECVYLGDGTNKTVKEELKEIKNSIGSSEIVVNDKNYKIEEIQNLYPKCKNFKGMFKVVNAKNYKDNGSDGDFYICDEEYATSIDCYTFRRGDVVLLENNIFVPCKMYRHPKPINIKNRYDVCIVGGGAGGMGAAYALKDKGYSVVLIDKNDALGGTHTLGGVVDLIASPAPDYFKQIMKDGYDLGKVRFRKGLNDVEGETFEDMWLKSCYNKSGTFTENGYHIVFEPIWLQERYYADLRGKIDICYNTELVKTLFDGDKVLGIKVINRITGKENDIYAEYFIDASADGVLCINGKEEGIDYFIGADAKNLYNETAIRDGFEGDRYEINTPEVVMKFVGFSYKPGETKRAEDADMEKWKTYNDQAQKVNYIANTYYAKYISASKSLGLSPKLLIDYGHDAAYSDGCYRTKSWWKLYSGYKAGNRYFEPCEMLALRETNRIKCDRMLTQSDSETLASVDNLESNHTIAISSWYTDMHNSSTSITGTINDTMLNGIPYESLIPSCYKNVLIGSRCLGASHVAASSHRLARTMMCLGNVAGLAIQQCLEQWLDDVRKIDIVRLQSDAKVTDRLNDALAGKDLL